MTEIANISRKSCVNMVFWVKIDQKYRSEGFLNNCEGSYKWNLKNEGFAWVIVFAKCEGWGVLRVRVVLRVSLPQLHPYYDFTRLWFWFEREWCCQWYSRCEINRTRNFGKFQIGWDNARYRVCDQMEHKVGWA